MQPASCTIQSEPADDGLPELLYEFTPVEVEALEETRRKLNFTSVEVEELERRSQADIKWIATADTLEEQRRRGDRVWAETIERPRAARRIETARRVAPAATRPTRPERGTRIAQTKAPARRTLGAQSR